MAQSDIEIIVEDPTAPEADSPAVTSTRTVEIVVSLLLVALAVLLGYDNWRTGISWDSTGPQAGYFPFYLCVILAGASLYGIVVSLRDHAAAVETFVTRAQLRRVMQVFVPTLLFCLAMQFLGLYVASFLLTAGFMRLIGKIAWWKSLLTAFIFTAAMFITFDIAFDVIMPKGPLEAAFGYEDFRMSSTSTSFRGARHASEPGIAVSNQTIGIPDQRAFALSGMTATEFGEI